MTYENRPADKPAHSPRRKTFINKNRPSGQRPKATFSHDSALNDLVGQKVLIVTMSDADITGTLKGYDAFTLTVTGGDGSDHTYFKHALESFGKAPAEKH